MGYVDQQICPDPIRNGPEPDEVDLARNRGAPAMISPGTVLLSESLDGIIIERAVLTSHPVLDCLPGPGESSASGRAIK